MDRSDPDESSLIDNNKVNDENKNVNNGPDNDDNN
jgi:hypothetical protein